MYTLYLRIDGLPKTINGMIGKANWWTFKKEADKWKNLVHLHTLNRRPPQPLKHAKLILVRASSAEPDWDNLCSSFKRIIDGLVKSGILEDDKMSNIGQPEYRWVKTKPGKGYVEVFVDETGPHRAEE